jgi:hypothetical protein
MGRRGLVFMQQEPGREPSRSNGRLFEIKGKKFRSAKRTIDRLSSEISARLVDESKPRLI